MYKSRSRFQGCEGTSAFIRAKIRILPDLPTHSQAVRTSPAPSDFKVAPMAGICGFVWGCCLCVRACVRMCVCVCFGGGSRLSHGFHGKIGFTSALRKIPTRRKRARAGGLNHLVQTAGFADAAGGFHSKTGEWTIMITRAPCFSPVQGPDQWDSL